MKIDFGKRASADIERIDRWWREHRTEAATVFIEEIAAALALLQDNPAVGPYWTKAREPGVRRVLLPRSRQFLYFRVVDGSPLHVIAIWGAQRERGPWL